jgi:hypothetical protein
MRRFCLTDDTPFVSSGERAKQLPVPSSHESILLRGLQSGYPFLWKKASEGLRGILQESFHPASHASSFPKGKHGGLVSDAHEMITDHMAGQEERWPIRKYSYKQALSLFLIQAFHANQGEGTFAQR